MVELCSAPPLIRRVHAERGFANDAPPSPHGRRQKSATPRDRSRSIAHPSPGNAEWQRDLSVSYDKIGRVLEKLGRMEEALVHYQKDLEIAERLAKLDPSNATWQKDVEISRARMARLKP